VVQGLTRVGESREGEAERAGFEPAKEC
jgi:hypothetical protein